MKVSVPHADTCVQLCLLLIDDDYDDDDGDDDAPDCRSARPYTIMTTTTLVLLHYLPTNQPAMRMGEWVGG